MILRREFNIEHNFRKVSLPDCCSNCLYFNKYYYAEGEGFCSMMNRLDVESWKVDLSCSNNEKTNWTYYYYICDLYERKQDIVNS
ncbi:hypothetical protein M0R19_05790 [Candidatus Pacearchaeota archaeon]|jgi:hypothetical protein|nr:hypothetical protein [Candidatus Pacearchaeota archaeon]